jgi:arylsulfatase A-like enzyme
MNSIAGRFTQQAVVVPLSFPTVRTGRKLDGRGGHEKLIEKSVSLTGGYVAQGTPTKALLAEIQFVDTSIGEMIAALKRRGAYQSTLIVITAKHGQSPIDSARYTGITSSGPVTTSPATILDNAGCSPLSESPSNPTGIGPTEDDVSLVWLNGKPNCTTTAAVGILELQSPASKNIAGIGEIFSGPAITRLFNAPGLPPNGDPRTPDILVTPNIGVTYSGGTKKLAEHGGFSHDDTNVMMLLSNPGLQGSTVTSPVETMQVAPTILNWG